MYKTPVLQTVLIQHICEQQLKIYQFTCWAFQNMRNLDEILIAFCMKRCSADAIPSVDAWVQAPLLMFPLSLPYIIILRQWEFYMWNSGVERRVPLAHHSVRGKISINLICLCQSSEKSESSIILLMMCGKLIYFSILSMILSINQLGNDYFYFCLFL